jgi:hypothetical protein
MNGTVKSQHKRGFGWWWKRVLIVIVGLPVILLGISFVNHQVATSRDRQNFPPPGELVDVGGYELHIYCLGEGSPTVVLEAGANSWSLVWSLVQKDVSGITRVCSYDRAGLGWSDPERPGKSRANSTPCLPTRGLKDHI